jgi:hypothetical protein
MSTLIPWRTEGCNVGCARMGKTRALMRQQRHSCASFNDAKHSIKAARRALPSEITRGLVELVAYAYELEAHAATIGQRVLGVVQVVRALAASGNCLLAAQMRAPGISREWCPFRNDLRPGDLSRMRAQTSAAVMRAVAQTKQRSAWRALLPRSASGPVSIALAGRDACR